MITIDALLKDGRSALADLDGASPTGGFVTSVSRPACTLLTGDVIRHRGGWHVVSDVRHNGRHGISEAVLVAGSGESVIGVWAGESAEVRTDARIDPDTLWKLQPPVLATR